MSKIKVSNATNSQLDWLVAKAKDMHVSIEGVLTYAHQLGEYWSPTIDWYQGGALIEREEIDIYCYKTQRFGCGEWGAEITGTKAKGKGRTPLIAAMRCLVASKLGEEVEVPEELC